jgi:hypothetical protein
VRSDSYYKQNVHRLAGISVRGRFARVFPSRSSKFDWTCLAGRDSKDWVYTDNRFPFYSQDQEESGKWGGGRGGAPGQE